MPSLCTLSHAVPLGSTSLGAMGLTTWLLPCPWHLCRCRAHASTPLTIFLAGKVGLAAAVGQPERVHVDGGQGVWAVLLQGAAHLLDRVHHLGPLRSGMNSMSSESSRSAWWDHSTVACGRVGTRPGGQPDAAAWAGDMRMMTRSNPAYTPEHERRPCSNVHSQWQQTREQRCAG